MTRILPLSALALIICAGASNAQAATIFSLFSGRPACQSSYYESYYPAPQYTYYPTPQYSVSLNPFAWGPPAQTVYYQPASYRKIHVYDHHWTGNRNDHRNGDHDGNHGDHDHERRSWR